MIRPTGAYGGPVDLEKLRYPMYMSAKIDGIRAILHKDKSGTFQLYSKRGKLIPNRHLQEQAALFNNVWEGEAPNLIFDGELVTGMQRPMGGDIFHPYNEIQSNLMSEDGEPEVTFLTFDMAYAAQYHERYFALGSYVVEMGTLWMARLTHVVVHNAEEVQNFLDDLLSKGYEGAMLRDPNCTYMYGNSTLKEQALIKLKPFEDTEARILGYEEEETNLNDKEYNEHGLAKRSSHKDNKVPNNRLGALYVEATINDKIVQFSVGSGFTDAQRIEFWNNKESLVDKHIVVKYQKHGMKDKPRHPVFKGFRNVDID